MKAAGQTRPKRPLPARFAGEWFYRILPARAKKVARLLARLAESPDEETVHDLRVTLRRLSCSLKVLRVPGRRRKLQRLISDCRRMERRLSAVRNGDVSIAWVKRRLPQAAGPEDEARRHCIERQRSRRAKRLRRARRALDQAGLKAIGERTLAALWALPLSPATMKDAWGAFRKGLRAAANQVDRLAAPLSLKSSDRAWHDVRKALRRVRYGAEDSREAIGRPSAKLIRELVERQQLLGEAHDASVLQRKLRRTRAQAPPSLAEALETFELDVETMRRERLARFCASRPDAVWNRAIRVP